MKRTGIDFTLVVSIGFARAKVQFTATSYAVLESEKIVHIGVERKGNTKSAVTVQ